MAVEGPQGDRGRVRRWAVVGVATCVAVLAGACRPPLVGVLPDLPDGPDGTGGSRGSAATPGAGAPSQPRASRPGADGRCTQPREGSEFQRVDPLDVALDGRAVADAVAYGTARGAQSVRVYRHDCLVATSSFDPTNEWSPLPSWSMTKGVVAVVVGRAVTMGHLDVDDPIGRHLDGLSPQHAAITVRQLLTQTSGLRFAWVNDLNAAALLDSAALVLTRPFEAEPGTTFVYAQTTVTALVAIVEAATGEDFQAFAAREVFEPIGITAREWTWGRDGAGRTQGFAFLDMTPRGYGRLGSLLLDGGRWRGRELVDVDYIEQGRTGTDANPSYGFLWWNNATDRYITAGFPAQQEFDRHWLPSVPDDAFGLTGLFDQQLLVIPSLDMVVLRMGQPHELFGDPLGEVQAQRPRWDHRFYRILLGGVADEQVPDVGDWVPDPVPPPVDWSHIFGVGF